MCDGGDGDVIGVMREIRYCCQVERGQMTDGGGGGGGSGGPLSLLNVSTINTHHPPPPST